MTAHAQAAGDVPATPPPPADKEEDGSGWVLPPLRLSGVIAYDFRAARSSSEGTSLSHLLTGRVSAQTYIYAPWMALVSGDLGLSTQVSREGNGALVGSSNEGDATVHDRITARQQFITGSTRVDLFPRSRFPFEAHYERNDSRSDSGLGTVFQFRTQSLGMSQHYRPPAGGYQVNAAFNHLEQSGLGFNSKQDTFTGDFSTRWKAHELGVSLAHSRAFSAGTDDDSRFDNIVAHHNYAPSSELSVNSTANWSRTQELAAASPSDLQVAQFNTIGLWRAQGSKLSLTGSARALAVRQDVDSSSVDSIGGTLGGSYEVNEHLRLEGSGGVGVTRSSGHDASNANAAVNASYQGDTINFAGINYSWFAAGGLGLAANDGGERGSDQQATVSAQIGHTATRMFRLGEASELSLTGSQTIAWARTDTSRDTSDDPLGQTRNLVSNLSATWQKSNNGSNTFARLSYSDSREFSGERNNFQLFNFQLSGTVLIDSRRSLTGDLTYQRTWQRTNGILPGAGAVGLVGQSLSSSSVGGEITYRENDLFGVRRLRFVSRLRLAQDVLKQPGTLLSLPDRETRMWENRLDWAVGRLETQLVLRLSEIDGQRRHSLMVRVQRSFGQ